VTVRTNLGGMGRPLLDVQAIVTPTRHTLVLSGELEITSAAELQDLVARIGAEGTGRDLELDLTGLTFLDSTGLQAIIIAQRLCRENEIGFMLTPARGAVQHLFEITGLTDVLPFIG
jgi:anti-sigma B factor antagonist